MNNEIGAYNLGDSLGNLTTLYSRAILKRIARDLGREEIKLTAEEWTVLVHIQSVNGRSQGCLCAILHKNKTTVARLVGSVEAKGLVERKCGEADSREKLVYLTELGQQTMQRVSLIVQEILNESYKNIDPQELEICRSVLRQAHRNLTNRL